MKGSLGFLRFEAKKDVPGSPWCDLNRGGDIRAWGFSAGSRGALHVSVARDVESLLSPLVDAFAFDVGSFVDLRGSSLQSAGA